MCSSKSSLHSQLFDAIADVDTGHLRVDSIVLDMTSEQVNKKGPSGWTPLHYATELNNKEAVAVFLRVINIEVNSLNSCGMTPLLVAAKYGAKDTIKLLLEDDRIDLNVKTRDGVGLEDVVVRGFGSLPEDKEEVLSWIKQEREFREKLKQARLKQESKENVLKKISKEEEQTRINILANQFNDHCTLTVSLSKENNKTIDVPDGNNFKRKSSSELKNPPCANDIVKENKYTNDVLRVDLVKKKDTDEVVSTAAEMKLSILEDNQTEDVKGANESYNDDETGDNDDLESHLQCPVCLELMVPPTRIWQCAKSHPICQGCKNKMDQINDRFCPICRSQPIMGRAHTIESIVRSLYPRRISSMATKKDRQQM